MKKVLFYTVFVLLAFAANAQKGRSIYYYYKGQKLYYPVSTDRLLVGTDPSLSFAGRRQSFARSIGIAPDSLEEVISGKQFIVKLGRNSKRDEITIIAKLLQQPGIRYARPVFLSPSGKYNSYGTDFIVKLKPATRYNQLQKLMDKYGCSLLRKYPFQENIYLLSAGKKAGYDGLAMANLFYETGLFDYAEPDKIVYGSLHTSPPNDPLYSSQWAHNNTGSGQNGNPGGVAGADLSVLQAWDITMGSPSIKVGVIDEGVDLTHPDLQANLLQGFNGATMTSNPGDGAPTYAGGAHGTNCAGIIAAIANNNIGVAGVAPNCKIIPANIFADANGNYSGDAAVAASFDYVRLAGADVISNSYGGGAPSSIIDDAINRAVTIGRGGKGCVVLFSSGNDNLPSIVYPSSNPQVISVGGVNMCGIKKSPTTNACDGEGGGVNYGPGLDVVAPCVRIATTDLQGSNGYNTNAGTAGDYNNIFNGTSAACPHAAAVVALILSVNPSYTVAEATAILELSCTRLPTYTYANNTLNQPNGSWNNATGHGLVNAFAAVQLAQSNNFCSVGIVASALVICQPVVLSVMSILPNATYQWYRDGTPVSTTTSYTTAMPGSYKVVCTRAACTSTSNAIALTRSVQINSISASPNVICKGGSTVLTLDAVSTGISYCTPVYTSGTGDGDFISKVNIAGTTLDNTSAGANASPYYTLYPANGSTTAALTANTPTPYTVSVNGGTYQDCYIRAWIDYNHDNIFDASESIGISGNVGSSANGTFTFSIPANAGNGLTRLRFRSDYVTTKLTANAACGNAYTQYGETEDYDISIAGGINISPVTYLWGEPAGSATLSTNNASQVTAANIQQSTAYQVNVTFTSGGCSAAATVAVSIFPGVSDTTATVCNSFTWHGVTYYHSGDKTFTIPGGGAAGCDSVRTLHLTITSIPNMFTKTDAGCYGSSTGSITISPAGGISPFTYRIGTTGPITAASGTFNNLKAGTYRVYVQDATGCIGVAAPIVIAQSAKPNATLTPAPVTGCYGGSNGLLTISNPTGQAPFKYKLGATGTYTSLTAPLNITNLKAGNYRIYIQDANGCEGATGAVLVTQPAAVPVSYSVIPITCSAPTGSISLGSSGNPSAGFKINQGSSNYTAQSIYNGLKAGTYYGYAKDANGCTGRSAAILLAPATGCSKLADTKSLIVSLKEDRQLFQVTLSPNPSNHEFTLVAHSAKTQPLIIKVMDAVGKIVYQAKGNAEQSFRFGSQFSNGLYLVEVRQGNDVRIMKVVKEN